MKKQCLKNYFIITLLSLGLILQSCGNIFQKTTLNGNNQISQKSFPISDNTDRFKNTYLSENVSPEKKAFRTWAVGCNQNLMVSRYLINPKSTDSTKNKVTITGSVKMDAVNGSGTNGNQVKLIINGVVETPIIALTTNTDCPSFGYFTYD